MVSSRSTTIAAIYRAGNALNDSDSTVHLDDTTLLYSPTLQTAQSTGGDLRAAQITSAIDTDPVTWQTAPPTFGTSTASTPKTDPPNNTVLVIVLVSTLGGIIVVGLIFLFLLR